jgi:hypothetical protein
MQPVSSVVAFLARYARSAAALFLRVATFAKESRTPARFDVALLTLTRLRRELAQRGLLQP